jgi:subtilisin family serine protease
VSGGIVYFDLHPTDKIILRNTVVNVLEAGVVAAIAVGNENTSFFIPPPNQVRTPANCPPPWLHPDQTTTGGLSCVIAVGGTDINDDVYVSSSLGPVTWQSITGYNDYPYDPGMGLIRPDVCAPGVNITSLNYADPTGYVGGWNGTSMATPCVAGTIALMLSKNIELTPAEIDEILETTAVRLPNQSSPKGNTFGSGRIDAYAAVQAVPCVPVYFTNRTVTTNTTVTGCSDIYVQNVTVTNGAKLILDAEGSVNIISDFEVQLGSQLEIKGTVNYGTPSSIQ